MWYFYLLPSSRLNVPLSVPAELVTLQWYTPRSDSVSGDNVSVLPVSGRAVELLPRVHVNVVKLVGLALVTLQVSVVELPSCTTGRDAVSSISGITGVGKSICMQLTSSVTVATIVFAKGIHRLGCKV